MQGKIVRVIVKDIPNIPIDSLVKVDRYSNDEGNDLWCSVVTLDRKYGMYFEAKALEDLKAEFNAMFREEFN